MNRYIPNRLNKIEEYRPGVGSYPVRLDANESPFSPPVGVMGAFAEAVKKIDYNRYPDPLAKELASAFAKAHGVAPENVVAGNGSDELISVIVNGFLSEGERLLVTAPDFSMYEFYGALRGVEILTLPKSEDHGIDFDKMLSVVEKSRPSALIFSNPCNPTGRAYHRDEIMDFVSRVKTLVIVDEAYAEFCGFDCSVLDRSVKTDNLIVLRTLSKAYGLAALRIGFAVANPALASAIRKVKSPYNVNTLTQLFALAALRHKEEYAPLIGAVIREKERLFERLCTLSEVYGFVVYPSDTNFVLIKCDDDDANNIYTVLCEEGIKIRCMPPYLRITAGSKEETEKFIKAFEAHLARKHKNR
ncbi:MAG: histidinol-phosphate transaminase [Clostridiales bacterium]|nr:histidinol-phosphate transaminase [Clostridiales bacterium]